MSTNKKIAFFGTPAFTVRFLDMLDTLGYTPSLIVTNPDRRAGRGMTLTAPEPKVWGAAHGITVLQPEVIDQAVVDELSSQHWDLFIVVAYGKILPEALITIPTLGTINVHYSLLPTYRGATPVESAILHGDITTGVSVQMMRYKLDSGPVIASVEVPIEATDTTPILREKLNDAAFTILPEVLENLFTANIAPVEQDETKATHSKKIKKEDGCIDLHDDPIVNDRKFRAYSGSIGTYFIAQKNGKDIRVKIKSVHLLDGRFVIDTVIPENGKPMSFESFVSL